MSAWQSASTFCLQRVAFGMANIVHLYYFIFSSINRTDNRSMMISSRWYDCWYPATLLYRSRLIYIHVWHGQSDWYLSSIILFTLNGLHHFLLFFLCVNLTFFKIVGIIHRYLDQFKSIINKPPIYMMS
jgi:hypothetical protein